KLKCRLMPYLYAHAAEAARTGIPIMRAMLLEFPGDPTADYLDRQYMLGERLLVAPVFSPDGAVSYYVPAGRWTNFLTGEVKVGPAWVRETHGMLSIPLLVRPNSLIAVGKQDALPDYDYADGVTLRLYELADGEQASAIIPTSTGATEVEFAARRAGNQITIERRGPAKPWQILLVGIASVGDIAGGSAEPSALGALITPGDGADTISIRLA